MTKIFDAIIQILDFLFLHFSCIKKNDVKIDMYTNLIDGKKPATETDERFRKNVNK